MVGHLLRHFELTAVTQIFLDTGRAEGVATNLGLDAGVRHADRSCGTRRVGSSGGR
jgi:hypothetical protein